MFPSICIPRNRIPPALRPVLGRRCKSIQRVDNDDVLSMVQAVEHVSPTEFRVQFFNGQWRKFTLAECGMDADAALLPTAILTTQVSMYLENKAEVMWSTWFPLY